MANFNSQIRKLWGNYIQISDKSYDDNFFAQKYGEIGINSRKEWFIWKSNINSMIDNETEKAEYAKKYRIKF